MTRLDRGRRSVNEVGIDLLHHWFLMPGATEGS
jgi:hypothetical protein